MSQFLNISYFLSENPSEETFVLGYREKIEGNSSDEIIN